MKKLTGLIAADLLDGFLTLFPHEMRDDVARGLEGLRAPLSRLGTEVIDAEEKGLSFAAAADRPHEFPWVARLHFGVIDFLQMEIPPSLITPMRSLIEGFDQSKVERFRKAMFTLAASDAAPIFGALLRLALYHALRLNVLLRTWTDGAALEANGTLDVFDHHAETVLRSNLDDPALLETDVRPLEVLVADAFLNLKALLERNREDIMHAMVDYQRLIERLETVENISRGLAAPDAALLREECRAERGHSAVGSQEMAHLHPLAFSSPNHVEQRRSRLLNKLKSGVKTERARTTRIIDLILPMLA